MFTMLAIAIVAPSAVVEPPPLTRIEDAYPSLSPDGKYLLFQSTRIGRWALYIADPDGNNVRVFLDTGDDPVGAVWSPDGRQIAYAATTEGQSEIFVIDAGVFEPLDVSWTYSHLVRVPLGDPVVAP